MKTATLRLSTSLPSTMSPLSALLGAAIFASCPAQADPPWTDLETQIDQNTSGIADLRTVVDQNTSDIANLPTDVGEITSDIADLTALVCNLYDEIGAGTPAICPQTSKRVFVSSQVYDGNLGGLIGADGKCQALANSAGLPGTYLAWLSTGISSPDSKFTHNQAPYLLVDDTQVADNWDDLTDGDLDAAIDLDENGTFVSSYTYVWTGTDDDGTPISIDCNGWTVTGQNDAGWIGHVIFSDYRWTDGGAPAGVVCQALARLYCFQQ
jgi:hypothetical protein